MQRTTDREPRQATDCERGTWQPSPQQPSETGLEAGALTPAADKFRPLLKFGTLVLGMVLMTSAAVAQNDAGKSAAQLIEQLKQEPAQQNVSQAIERAETALDEARAARKDSEVAATYEAAAKEWASVGIDWLQVSQREAEAARVEEAVAETRRELKHQRALLEETAARKGRAEGLLKQLESPTTATDALAPTSGAQAEPAPGAKP